MCIGVQTRNQQSSIRHGIHTEGSFLYSVVYSYSWVVLVFILLYIADELPVVK